MDANELVERVAGSMYASDHKGMANVWAWDEAGLEDEHPGIRDIYLRKARAALREIVAAAGVSRVAMIGHADDIERKWPGDKIAALLRALAEGGKDA